MDGLSPDFVRISDKNLFPLLVQYEIYAWMLSLWNVVYIFYFFRECIKIMGSLLRALRRVFRVDSMSYLG